jgi:hypothetical protein
VNVVSGLGLRWMEYGEGRKREKYHKSLAQCSRRGKIGRCALELSYAGADWPVRTNSSEPEAVGPISDGRDNPVEFKPAISPTDNFCLLLSLLNSPPAVEFT